MDIVTDTSAVVAVILNEADKPVILQKTLGGLCTRRTRWAGRSATRSHPY